LSRPPRLPGGAGADNCPVAPRRRRRPETHPGVQKNPAHFHAAGPEYGGHVAEAVRALGVD
ncbi:hypothetical protein ABT404_38670, partial [Streptomyces hyaluromycini]